MIKGSKESFVKSVPSNEAVCTNCKTEGTMNYNLFYKYYHVFFIPVFPYSKSGTLECSACKEQLSPYKLSKATRNEYEKVKKGLWPPVWHFSGIALLAIIFYLVSLSEAEQAKTTRVILQSLR